jgi:hypothetical protein
MAKHHGFQATVNKFIFVNYMTSKIYKHIHIYNVRIIYNSIMNNLSTNHTDLKRNLIKIKNETFQPTLASKPLIDSLGRFSYHSASPRTVDSGILVGIWNIVSCNKSEMCEKV